MLVIPFLLSLASQTDIVRLANTSVTVSLSRSTGRFRVDLAGGVAIAGAHAEARLPDGSTIQTDRYPRHDAQLTRTRDSLGRAELLTVTNTGLANVPALVQRFWLYRNRPELVLDLELEDPSGKGTNRLSPLVTDAPIHLVHPGPVASLFVPYDNDSYFRYRSDAWTQKDGSYEVGAIYEDQSREGLVAGSIDHDVWKSAVKFGKSAGLTLTSGVTSDYTHDREDHGTVSGTSVRSARFEIGHYEDWRAGLERYGDLNAAIQPALPWKGGPPFGWNSWSGYKNKVTDKGVNAALDFVAGKMPLLRDDGTAYINFDSFWDNLTRDQRVAFVKRVHAAGLKAGIYWTPFVNWGEPDWKAVGSYKYGDMQLKQSNGVLFPKLDGGWPLDPTHPGTLQRIDENLKDFVDQGFDYIKFDFLTHGALEGKHFDPKVQTGAAAYRVGMKRIVDDLSAQKTGRPIFISLSIAPLFPSGYAHSRRISCDIFANIGASEYFLNSQNYAWWEAHSLYKFSDPDSACEYQPLGEPPTSEAEARTRFTASVIGGGMMIEGDNLENPAAEARVLSIFSHKAALDLARRAPRFLPVSGTTGDKAGDAFIYRQDARTAYVAMFNFDKTVSKSIMLPLARLGLPAVEWNGTNLWTGKTETVRDRVQVTMLPTDCALIRLERR